VLALKMAVLLKKSFATFSASAMALFFVGVDESITGTFGDLNFPSSH
jgi:hypothetical protein